jgi:5'-AMP-activated protein kinase catalytic alpha subunit
MSLNIMKKEVTIGQFRMGQVLGKGTFGEVRVGMHMPTGERVAIKILEKDKINDPGDVERVTREIAILKRLRHPNIIQLYEIMEARKEIYLVMEYAEGGELFDLIVKNQRLSERRAAGFLTQLLSGLEYIHQLGVVHRDLKPENLLLDQARHIKIVDFGLSNTYKPG